MPTHLIIGTGIIGLCIARSITTKHPDAKIVMLEKETDVALHGSGRNSGILHAGVYYTADSLKARFTRDGNRQLKAYCKTHNLKLNENEKVVVAKNESELPALFELEKRGIKNGVDVSIIDEKALHDIDPNVKTHKHALYSPSTAQSCLVQLKHKLTETLTYNLHRTYSISSNIN